MQDSLACADVGIDPGSPVFSQCVADLHHSLWRRRIRTLLTNPGCGLVSLLRVSCPQTAHDILAAISQRD
jgi:hypothetical protein